MDKSKGLNHSAVQAANAALWSNHPELKGRLLTRSASDAALRSEWMRDYQKSLKDSLAPPNPVHLPASHAKIPAPPACLGTCSAAVASAPTPQSAQCSFLKQSADDARQRFDLLKLCDQSYGLSDGNTTDGWISDPRAYQYSSGLFAELYHKNVNGVNQYVLVYRGSTPEPLDWVSDIERAGDIIPADYTGAVSLAMQLQAQIQRTDPHATLTLTGHSLGGGLASAASIATGLPALTYDSAGLSPATISSLSDKKPPPTSQISAYYYDWDPLSFLQDNPSVIQTIGLILKNPEVMLILTAFAADFSTGKAIYDQIVGGKNDLTKIAGINEFIGIFAEEVLAGRVDLGELNSSISHIIDNGAPSAVGNRIVIPPRSPGGAPDFSDGHSTNPGSPIWYGLETQTHAAEAAFDQCCG